MNPESNNLQGAGGSLQPQASPNQNSVNTQSGVDSLQNTSPESSILNQNSAPVLGVFSSPNDTTPDATVSQNTTTATINPPANNSNNGEWLILAGVLILVILGVLLYRKFGLNSSSTYEAVEDVVEEEVAAAPAVAKPKPKKQKRKKKSNRRG